MYIVVDTNTGSGTPAMVEVVSATSPEHACELALKFGRVKGPALRVGKLYDLDLYTVTVKKA